MSAACPPLVTPLGPLSGRIVLRPGVQVVPLGVVDVAPVGAGRAGVLAAPSGRLALWAATSVPLMGCAITLWVEGGMSAPPSPVVQRMQQVQPVPVTAMTLSSSRPRGRLTNRLRPSVDAHQVGDLVGELAHGPVSVDLVAASGGARFVRAWLAVACLPDVAGGIISTRLHEPAATVTHAPLSAVRELQSVFVDVEPGTDDDSAPLVIAGRARRSAGVRVTLTEPAAALCRVVVGCSHGGIEQTTVTIKTGAHAAYLALPNPRGQLRLRLQAAERLSALVTVGCHG